MPTYASKTEVPTDRSRAEIERTLVRYGATKFMYGWDESAAVVMFDMHKRRLKFVLPLPRRDEFRLTPTRKVRTESSQNEAYEQACRQRWRALALTIKAKLESVESGIEQFEEAFMPQIVLPNGDTIGEVMTPQIERAYMTGEMPPLLPAG
jgi:hypothetical protein